MAGFGDFLTYLDRLGGDLAAMARADGRPMLPSALIIETADILSVGQLRERMWLVFRDILRQAGRPEFRFEDVKVETLSVDSETTDDEFDRFFLVELDPVDQLADDVAHGRALIELAEWLELTIDWIVSAHADLTLQLNGPGTTRPVTGMHIGGCSVGPIPLSDPSFRQDWWMHSIQHPEAVGCAGLRQGDFSGAGITIGHIDTGYGGHVEIENGSCSPQSGHDFILKRPGGWEPANSGAISRGHGDSTASVIISRTPHNMRGVATGAVTVPYRAIEFVAVFTGMGRVVKAIRMAAQSGHPAISMSLGGISAFSGLEKQLRKAEAAGAICIAAAGNCVKLAVAPAISDHCIGVSGTAPDDTPWPHACSSPHGKLDIAAPAQWVQAASHKTSRPDLLSERGEGTSYATAMTTGAAAVWLGYHGLQACRDAADASGVPLARYFKALLRQTARVPANWSTNYGEGILNMCELLKAGLPAIPPTVTQLVVKPPPPSARTMFNQFVRTARPDRADQMLADL